MTGQPDLLELDEVARWEHDLEHCTWLIAEQEPQAPETIQMGD